jgi:hypothetical protein
MFVCQHLNNFLFKGANIWGETDSFYYIYKAKSTDGTISCAVESFTHIGTDYASAAGIDIRDSLSPNANHVFLGFDASK